MSKKIFIYMFLSIIVAVGSCLSIVSIISLTQGEHIFNGILTELKLAVLLVVSLLVSMLAVSAIILKIRKDKFSKNN